jgi:4-aminobutyrate aminotransferase-like enzyme
VKNVIETTTNGKIAGMIVEPIMGVGGFIDPPTEYHKEVFDIVKSFGGAYISDEVQTGVGRTGKNFFAIQDSGVEADIITMAKGLGNGAPVGAVIAKNEYADSLAGKVHFNTFGGDPFQSTQAGEVIDIFDDENCLKNADELGRYLLEGLLTLQNEFPLIGDVRGRGLILGLELVKDPVTKEHASEETVALLEECRNQGLLVGKGGLKGNVIRVTPPLNITKDDCDEIIQKLQKAFANL